MTFDRTSDYEQGREDALNGLPRTSTRSHYRSGYDRGLSAGIAAMKKCTQCGAAMNPAEAMLGPVCGKCCRANHKKAAG